MAGGKGARPQESAYAGSVELCMLEMKVERTDGPVTRVLKEEGQVQARRYCSIGIDLFHHPLAIAFAFAHRTMVRWT